MSDAPHPRAGPDRPPPGWYPDDQGRQRWWDGTDWVGEPMVPATTATPATNLTDDRMLATIAHVSGLFTFLGPLIIYLVKKDESAFVRHHAAEALNFAITVAIAMFVSFLLIFVLVGFLLIPVVGIAALVCHILAAVAANRGEWYRYPISIRLVPGAY